jgi:hypothetical protein
VPLAGLDLTSSVDIDGVLLDSDVDTGCLALHLLLHGDTDSGFESRYDFYEQGALAKLCL